MAAVATKKPGSDFGQQLTFPAVYSETVNQLHQPFAYYPDPKTRPVPLPADYDTVQGTYHEQKRQDANRRALAGVKDTQMAKYRFTHSHAGYWKMPKPVLSQRIYANPSFGNQADIYSARPSLDSLSGGVLYTKEAQKWGRQQLKNRVNQLNAIDAAKQEFLSGVPSFTTSEAVNPVSESEHTKLDIEVVQTLQGLFSQLQSGKADAIAYNDMIKFLRLVFRWTITATEEDLKDVLEYLDEGEEYLLGLINQLQEGEDADADVLNQKEYVAQIYHTIDKVRDYLSKMVGVVNFPIKEKKAASANYLKTLGLTKLSTAKKSAEQIKLALKQAKNQEIYEYAQEYDVPYNEAKNYFDSYDVQPSFAPPRTVIGSEAPFEKSIPKFDPSVRQQMGANNGAYLGEELPEGANPQIKNPFRQDSSSAKKRRKPKVAVA